MSALKANPPVFAIGDIQGCDTALETLLAQLPANAEIICLGDLVNRGPNSLAVLRRLKAMGNRAKVILGNHDIHLLACAHKIRQPRPNDTLDEILQAPDCWELIDWLRHQPLARIEQGFLCVHAGVLPQWSLAQTLSLAHEVEQKLQSDHYPLFLTKAFGNQPDQWSADLNGDERLRLTINVLTRLRFCTATGRIDFSSKNGLLPPPSDCLPWFDQPRYTADTPIAFGHWSTMGLINRPQLIGLDTGCVWGGKLSAICLSQELPTRQLIQVAGEERKF